MQEGEIHLVYDYRIWNKRKHDLNHNEDCWKKATIVKIYRDEPTSSFPNGEEMADVVFLHDGWLSRGHFTSVMDHHLYRSPRV